MKRKIFFVQGTSLFMGILFFSICITTISCSDCEDTPKQDKAGFTSIYSGYMPFSGKEILRFLKNGKDTVLFTGQGKEIYKEEVARPGGDCEVTYVLPHHKVSFKSRSNERLLLHYYKYSKTNAFRDYFEVEYNARLFGPYVVNVIAGNNEKVDMQILGRKYLQVLPLYENNDTIYLSGLDALHQVVRIKYQTDTYEVLPE